MTRHLSDLAMEKLFAGEGPPSAHLHSCDACWDRWVHLHADEGRTLPHRLQRHTARTPWVIAAISTTIAIAATAMLALSPTAQPIAPESGNLSTPREALSQDATAAAPAASPDIATPSPVHLESPRFKGSSQPSTASNALPEQEIGEAQLERAVEDEIRRRKADRMDKAIAKWEDRVWTVMGDHLGILMANGEIVGEQADEIEQLIQDEMERVFELKSLSRDNELSPEEGKAEYMLIRETTDLDLIEILGEEGTLELRALLDSK